MRTFRFDRCDSTESLPKTSRDQLREKTVSLELDRLELREDHQGRLATQPACRSLRNRFNGLSKTLDFVRLHRYFWHRASVVSGGPTSLLVPRRHECEEPPISAR